MSAAFFDEPFDKVAVVQALTVDRARFFMSAYMVCGLPERWHRCLEQLPKLFRFFADEQIPDGSLYELAALMWRWSLRLSNSDDAQEQFSTTVRPILDWERLRRLADLQFDERGWRGRPWEVRKL